MVKTHMKCCIRRHFIRVCTDSLQGQIHFRNEFDFWNVPGFYRTQYPASYTHKLLGRTPQFTLPGSAGSAGTQTCLLFLSLKSQIPKLFRNDSAFPIFTAYLLINRTGAVV